MSYQRKKNIYLCQYCGRGFVSIDIDDGTTPFMTGCIVCKGTAVSMMYQCPQVVLAEIPAALEWYKPKALEYPSLPQHTRNHVDKGGLISRVIPIPAKPEWPRSKTGGRG